MSHLSRRRPPALLGPRAPPSAWLLLASILAGLAAAGLVLVVALMAGAVPALAARLAGSATVVVSGRVDSGTLESSDAAAARAREALAADPAVAGVQVLDPAPLDDLMARALQAPRSSADTGPPRVLAVRLRPPASGPAADIAGPLRTEGLLFAIDDHGLWTGPCERGLGLLGLALVVGLMACLAVLAYAGDAAAGRRTDETWSRLDLLAQLGAAPERLARAIAWPAALTLSAAAAAGAGAGLVGGWLAWFGAGPVADLIAPSAPLAVGLAVAWLVLGAVCALASCLRQADRRLRALFS
jgi:hypothetical protein